VAQVQSAELASPHPTLPKIPIETDIVSQRNKYAKWSKGHSPLHLDVSVLDILVVPL
jgi:hypothetical protein